MSLYYQRNNSSYGGGKNGDATMHLKPEPRVWTKAEMGSPPERKCGWWRWAFEGTGRGFGCLDQLMENRSTQRRSGKEKSVGRVDLRPGLQGRARYCPERVAK